MFDLRSIYVFLCLAIGCVFHSASSTAATPCQELQTFATSMNMELAPLATCTFQANGPQLVIFLNYTPAHQKSWLPQVEYAVNGQVLNLPTHKFYFVQLQAGERMSFRNLTNRKTDLSYFAGEYWSLLIWCFCLISSILGAAIASAYCLLYRRMNYFHLAFFSLSTTLYNVLHPTAFTLNYVAFFVMVSSYFNVVLGFQRPIWNQRILMSIIGIAGLWLLSFSTLPYDINIKISMISSVTGLLILLLSIYNLWRRTRIIISVFALSNTLFIFYLGLAERQHLFAATFIQSIFICMMTYRLLQTSVENEKKARDAQKAIASKNLELAQINESLESRVKEQTADLRQQTESLAILAQSSERILENIEEGIICFSHDFKVERVSSWAERELHIKTGQDILPFFASLDANPDMKVATLQGLKLSMGADPIQWELNRSHYLEKIQLGEKVLRLDFHPIIYEQSVQSVILTVHDRTEESVRKEQQQQSDERFLRLVQKAKAILSGGTVARIFLQEVGPLAQDLHRLPKAPRDEAHVMLRNLHTIKGAARTAQFHDISTLAHHLESLYSEGQFEALQAGLENLQRDLEEYALATREVFGSGQTIEPLNRLLDIVHALKSPMEKQLAAHDIKLQSVIVADALDALPHGLYECLMHVMNNICDHGFIRPLQKGAQRRNARISFTGFYQGPRATIEIRDNGQGLNWNRIRELCFQRQFIPERDRPASDVLFLDGLSTADFVSESSGRGVGLGFVKQVVSTWPKGEVWLLDNDEGTGTLFRIEWDALNSASQAEGF